MSCNFPDPILSLYLLFSVGVLLLLLLPDALIGQGHIFLTAVCDRVELTLE